MDLLRYSRSIGGLDRVYTVLQDLGEKMEPSNLVAAAKSDGNLTYAQRAGWLLEKAGFSKVVEKLAGWLVKKHPVSVKLDPSVNMKDSPRANPWSIVVNTKVEGDL